jgi:formylglycine-generating enzyme required for sulfatase activity
MIDIDMVKIPGGNFLMGSPDDDPNSCDDEHPQHLVTISSFWMSKTTITEKQWRFVASLPTENLVLNKSPYDYPVVGVKWNEAIEFCDRLSRVTGKDYRLPSEAEWEYACRAGTKTAYFFGNTLTKKMANFYRKGREDGLMPVGQFPPNAFGLYDMHGNVWEWCQDNWHDNYDDAPTDGIAWSGNNTNRVMRGGSWKERPRLCRSAYRRNYITLDNDNGFRVVCSNL